MGESHVKPEVEISLLNQTAECAHPVCREKLIEMINEADKNHVTHRSIMAYVGVPIGVLGIIIGLVMTIVSSNFGALQQNLMVSKQRNDYQDQRITQAELADSNMKGDLAVIRTKMENMDKTMCTIAESVHRIEQRK